MKSSSCSSGERFEKSSPFIIPGIQASLQLQYKHFLQCTAGHDQVGMKFARLRTVIQIEPVYALPRCRCHRHQLPIQICTNAISRALEAAKSQWGAKNVSVFRCYNAQYF
jgi:hypothetical protein